MTRNRVRLAVWVPLFVASLGFAGCGAASATASGEGTTPGAQGANSDASAPEDAGPTTTTTVALGSAASVEGSKLTSTSTEATDSAGDGGAKGPRSSEVGRGTKDIQAIVVARRDDARACYDAAVKAHPGIEGNLDIRWTIDPKGNVTDIAVDTSHSDILEPTVGNCVIAIIKKIHFNESAKGFETRTHYPFNFHPRAGGPMAGRPDAGGH